jgi:hypothetical protein
MINPIYIIIIILFAVAIIQGCVLPWVISNSVLPVWADLGILCLICLSWIFLISVILSYAIKKIKNQKNNL